ncbi:MATE family efflux transporter [Simkania sp.]|uniref:MATE family efflux transporter n=1 Tax=Simkania sp. TaxID=34094 RepID=UPI003B51EB06
MKTNEIREGSLSQLWKISSSLMVSFFSMVAMMFCDRLFLANYSASALSAAASAGTLFWAGNFMVVTLCAMSEVFVAQYNGAKRYNKLGEPVWQMIWLAIFSCIFFFCLGTFGSNQLYSFGFFNSDEVLYFKWNNFFAPAFSLLAAISAFFIGQGKTQIIKWMAILGNVVNIILDPLFIFGVKGWIPEMGIKGAAIATGLGVILQIVVLGAIFLRQNNREFFGTNDWKFKKGQCWNVLKIAMPPAFFVMFELIGWALFYKMMEKLSPTHILVTSVTQSVLLLLIFFGLAIEKGAAAVAGNLIGAKLFHEVKRVFKSGVILGLCFSGVLAVVLIGFPNYLIEWFFHNPAALEGDFVFSPELLLSAKSAIKFALAVMVVYLTFENIRFLLGGMLTAAGDTMFLMIAGAGSIWLFMLAPTYFFMVKPQANVEVAFYIWMFYSAVTALILYIRFAMGKWREKHLIDENSTGDGAEASTVPSVHPSGEVTD